MGHGDGLRPWRGAGEPRTVICTVGKVRIVVFCSGWTHAAAAVIVRSLGFHSRGCCGVLPHRIEYIVSQKALALIELLAMQVSPKCHAVVDSARRMLVCQLMAQPVAIVLLLPFPLLARLYLLSQPAYTCTEFIALLVVTAVIAHLAVQGFARLGQKRSA